MGRYIVILNEARLERLDITRAMVTPSESWTDTRPGLQRQEAIYFTLLGLRIARD